MLHIATLADKLAAEAEAPAGDPWQARSLYEQLVATATRFPARPAISFQLKSGPADKSVSITWADLRAEVTRAANLFRSLGVGPQDGVAYVLPNGLEAPIALLAGATAGIVVPINPLLAPEHIAAILRETGVKVVVTLAPFPQTDLAPKVDAAVALAPEVSAVLQVDLARYLPTPLAWAMPMLRPKLAVTHKAQVLDFQGALKRQPADRLDFAETLDDRVCACFHTGGTTGLPKVAQHRARGILYNGWIGSAYMFTEADVLMCPLPMFHVLAAYPIFMSCLVSGAQVVFPTPQGYRGAGVLKNFWKLIERYRVSFLITVPTAASALMQRPIDADVSTLRLAISGSAAMPVELFNRFEAATGVMILEGYGMTEATCLVAINPPYGERKIGSVGIPFVHTDVRILKCDAAGAVVRECGTDEVGEILREEPRRGGAGLYRPGQEPRADHAGGLSAHRGFGADRCGRVYLDHRSRQGADHPRRAQHRPGGDRGGADRPSRRGLRRGDRPAGCPCRRGAGGLCRADRGGQRGGGGTARARQGAYLRAGGGAQVPGGAGRTAQDRGGQGLQAGFCGAGRSPGSTTRLWRRRGWRRGCTR